MKFCIYGDGTIAGYHKEAIRHVGGTVHVVHDPPKEEYAPMTLIKECDYSVICSPTYLHREHTKDLLALGQKMIVEKPAVLPWEPLIDNNRVNVVLQLRYLDNLPEKADKIKVSFQRGARYFDSWKGDPSMTGGLFYNLFIHYIDLAIRLKADFEGIVKYVGDVYREVHSEDGQVIDILNIDRQALYNRMYEDIVSNKGIKPSDLYYLHYVLRRYSEINGYHTGNRVIIPREML